jgi:PAS domain S-box-containing protein
MHQTTLRFGSALWEELEIAARAGGTSIAQFVREAAIARLSYTAGRNGDMRLQRALGTARDDTRAETQAGVAVVVLDATGHVTAWNGGAERVLGLQASEARGRSLADLHLAALTPAVRQIVALSLQTGQPASGTLESKGQSIPVRALPLPSPGRGGSGAVLLVGEPFADDVAGIAQGPAT